MIFASDLDRTLIYSQRALRQLGVPADVKLRPVEKKAGGWVSFMTAESAAALQDICRQGLFVPVTTRTVEQFQRITILQDAHSIPYVIAANGATILYKGEELTSWSEHVAALLRTDTAPIAEAISYFYQLVSANAVVKQVEDLFFYFLFDRPPLEINKHAIRKAAAILGWKVSLQGRKLYFIPKSISKGAALRYICEREGMRAAAGAGDSTLDWDFLEYCDQRYIPRHGELAHEENVSGAVITNHFGVKAGEEILQQFQRMLA